MSEKPFSGRPTREAAYESRCAWCDRMILEGDEIGLSEPDGEWVHVECAEEEPWPDG